MTPLQRDLMLEKLRSTAFSVSERIREHTNRLLIAENETEARRKSRNEAKGILAELEADYARLLQETLSTECEIALMEKYK